MADEYMIQKETLDNIANGIHSVNGESSAYSPATMKTKIDDISDDVTDQSNLISQIQTALNNKITPPISVSAAGLVTAGSSTHQLSSSDDADFIAANIAKNITIFGTTGTHEGGITPSGTLNINENGTYDVTDYASANVSVSIVTEEKTATPTKSTQNITPTSGKVLSKVVVNPIPDNYVDLNDFTDTDALAGNILSGKTAYAFDSEDGFTEIEGTIPNNGAQSGTLDTATTSKTIPAGYTNGGTVSVASEAKTATPSTSQQVIKGTSNKYLTQVTVSAIPAQYVDSSTVDAVAGNVLSGKKAVVNTGTNTYAVVSGTMTNNGATSGTIDGLTTTLYSVPAGYTSGGTVSLTSDIEDALAAI